MAVIAAAIPLIVSETLTRSSGIPANASSMSASVSMAMPTRPTSPSARRSSESRPSWVGRSKATLSASCPCPMRYLNRALVSAGVPKPTYWRIVQGRARYMCMWMPRVNGYSPGRPMSRSKSPAAASSGPWPGLLGNPAGGREHREPDDVHALLDRLLHDLVRRPLEARVDDLDPRVAERQGHDLRAAVVAVEPRLGNQDFHCNGVREAATLRGWPETRRG